MGMYQQPPPKKDGGAAPQIEMYQPPPLIGTWENTIGRGRGRKKTKQKEKDNDQEKNSPFNSIAILQNNYC